ncbi:MAG: ribonuclease HI family protein [Acidobacteriota bacterium]
MDAVIAYIDGASRGNPGDAGYGVQVCATSGEEITAFGDYLGRQTNNHAEYRALLAALRWAHASGVDDLQVCSDSQLLVRQMNGDYRVKSATLRPLYEEARVLADRFDRFKIRHIPRGQNEAADTLANRAIDLAQQGDTG